MARITSSSLSTDGPLTTERDAITMALWTREVRWFHTGHLPEHVLVWFTSGADIGRERRVDRYDLAATAYEVGVKYRSDGTLDTKRCLGADHGVELAPGLVGTVEDWIKLSAPARPGEGPALVAVSKELLTRRYRLTGSTAGCEVELARILIGDDAWWSLCFETFGDGSRRGDALAHGVEAFLAETPMPSGLEFDVAASSSYPKFLTDAIRPRSRIEA